MQRDEVLSILAQHSDIDILVEFEQPVTLPQFP